MTPSVSARKFSLKNGGAHFPCVFSVQTTHFHLVISKTRFEIFRNGNVSFGPIEYGEKDTLRFGPEIFRSETEGVIFPAFYRSKPPMAAPGLLGPGTARRLGHITMVISTSARKVGTPSRNPHVSWLRTHVFLEGLGGKWPFRPRASQKAAGPNGRIGRCTGLGKELGLVYIYIRRPA